jgi:hypothetical protein
VKDLRWKQRNYTNALQTLSRAVELSRQRDLSELEQQGVIHGFEFTHERAWNVLKDYLEEQGVSASSVPGMQPAKPSGTGCSMTGKHGWT